MALSVVPLLSLLVLLTGSCPIALGAAATDEHGYTFVAISSLKPKATCSGHRVAPPHNSTWVPLHHPHGPCLPDSSGAAAPPSLAELLHLDQLRVDDIQMRLSGNHSVLDSKGPMIHGRTLQMNGVKAQVGYGSNPPAASDLSIDATSAAGVVGSSSRLPGVVQTVVVDTASDVGWVQCVPCPVPPCHPQTDTFFDPTKSSTYAAFPCNSPACTQLGSYANGCVNNQCQYRVPYPDGTSTSGTYSSDVLSFDATTSFSSFQFGCSHAVQGSFDSSAAGILALGGGPESLLSQTASRYGNGFYYCIAATPSSPGYLALGVPHQATFRYAVTPMLRDKLVPTFYRVLLLDITVNGQPLNVPRAVFAAGTVMDSRTIYTRLPPTAYAALRAAFRSSMSMYRSAPPQGALDTCYDFTGVTNIRLPTISLVFDRNAVVTLDPTGVLSSSGCLAFIPTADDRMAGILGSQQQHTIEVFYNVGGKSVAFRPAAC